MVERTVRGREVAGSSPATPTIIYLDMGYKPPQPFSLFGYRPLGVSTQYGKKAINPLFYPTGEGPQPTVPEKVIPVMHLERERKVSLIDEV
jgi:hypothetical protein